MATFVASQAVNMTTGLAALDSEVTFGQLLGITPDGMHQVWDVGGGTMVMDLDGTFGDTSFSVGITHFAFHHAGGEHQPLIWDLSDASMVMNGTFHMLDADSFNTTIDVPGFFSANITININTTAIESFDYSFDPGWTSFVAYLFRGNDSVTGSAGADYLLGHGGNDTMNGGGSNDVVDGGGGNDMMKGMTGADQLKGGAGADRLYGGAGNDKLTGGSGADKFYFDVAPDATANKDTILDFSHAQADKIVLDHTIFTKLVVGGSVASMLDIAGDSHAPDRNDYLYYNPSNGNLSYDATGGNHSDAVLFAVLGTTTHPATLMAADFTVIA